MLLGLQNPHVAPHDTHLLNDPCGPMGKDGPISQALFCLFVSFFGVKQEIERICKLKQTGRSMRPANYTNVKNKAARMLAVDSLNITKQRMALLLCPVPGMFT